MYEDRCNATDSKALFKVPNNGGYEATPEEEWNFVVNPDLAETYPGGRRGTKLDVCNLAHGAQKHGGAHLDIPLDIADNRLAEVAKQNACSAEELVDSVETVALRWCRARSLSEDPLKRAIKKLGETQEDHSETIRGLDALVKLGAKTLKKLGEMLGEALEKGPRVDKTGERSFAALAECVKDLASREMLEALSRYSRTKHMETKAREEDFIGLRLYTGGLRSRSCSRLLLSLSPSCTQSPSLTSAHAHSTSLHTCIHIFFISFAPLCLYKISMSSTSLCVLHVHT
jgi:hypothetical protein